MLKVAICDDCTSEIENMENLIRLYCLSKNLQCERTTFTNGFDLIAALEKGKNFDIYCLDILMPGCTGIDVAREIRLFDKRASLLFLTSSPEFALESYSVKATNYILKPITKEKLFEAFDDIFEQTKISREQEAIVVKGSKGLQKILISNLAYAEVMGRNTLYHLSSGNIVECTEAFAYACETLMKFGCFTKPHRSYIVNMQYIETIENQRITLQNLSSVPIAQGKGKEIKQQYLAYQMELD